jgi:hypothetical protein
MGMLRIGVLGASGEVELLGLHSIQAAFEMSAGCQQWGLYATVAWNRFLHPFDTRLY